jgi:hypothetical protein
MVESKICLKCKGEFPPSGFYKCSRRKDGLSYFCKNCSRVYSIENFFKIKERRRLKRLANKEEESRKSHRRYLLQKERARKESLAKGNHLEKSLVIQSGIFKPCGKCLRVLSLDFFSKNNGGLYGRHSNCRECVRGNGRKWYLLNTEKCSKKEKRNYSKNKGARRETQREYEREQTKTNPVYKLKKLLRSRLASFIKGGRKRGSAVRDLGCTGEKAKSFLESRSRYFLKDLGQNKVHIDHIIPLSQFDLSDRKELLKAVHYTNLQLLWWEDNQRKGNKIPDFAPYYGHLIWIKFPSLYPKDKSCAESTLSFSEGIDA